MARKIVGRIRPFEKKQELYVYEDGNKLDAESATLNELEDILFGLVEEYQINQVDLVGPKQYIAGIVNKLKQKEFTKYSVNKIKFNII